MFLANQKLVLRDFSLCFPSQRSACSQVLSRVATHQEIGSQLWAGEMPDSNPGLSGALPLSHYASGWAIMPPDWATMPPNWAIMPSPLSHHASPIEPPCLLCGATMPPALSHHASHWATLPPHFLHFAAGNHSTLFAALILSADYLGEVYRH